MERIGDTTTTTIPNLVMQGMEEVKCRQVIPLPLRNPRIERSLLNRPPAKRTEEEEENERKNLERIGDDMLISIFEMLHSENDRKSFSKVSKQFLKFACIFIKVLNVSSPDVLQNILIESPNKVEFKCSEPLSNTYMKLLARSSPKLQKLDLELDDSNPEVDFDDDGLRTVANACSHLRQVVLSRRLHVGDLGVHSIVRSCKNLQELDLTGCLSVTDKSLKAIGESNSLLILNLSECLITDTGLFDLTFGNLKNSLTKLDLSDCDRISENGDGIVCFNGLYNLKYLYLPMWLDDLTDSAMMGICHIPDISLLGC